jgi:hypothetical protein
MARAFISYKHDAQPDVRIADYLVNLLPQHGLTTFIDRQIPIGHEWPTAIEAELERADFLIVLLSEKSAASEMVIHEVSIAHRLKSSTGRPVILPVRVAFKDSLPYDLGAKLERIQYRLWQGDGDEHTIGAEIVDAMISQQDFAAPQANSTPAAPNNLAADGNAVTAGSVLAAPLPSFDVRWLDMLESPGGAVRLDSPFYIERELDEKAARLISKAGVTIRVRGSRQTGKSSALARLYQRARDLEQSAVYLDFQQLDEDQLANLDSLLQYLANFLAQQLATNESPDRYWKTALGPKDKLNQFIQNDVLARLQKPLVLIMDEVDRVFAFPYRNDFFGLVRSWHSRRAIDPAWTRLNLVLAYSTEATLLIKDQTQSPFNVGEGFHAHDLSRSQVETLNQKHGSPLKTVQEADLFMNLIGGHPFLVRRALYDLVDRAQPFAGLQACALDDDGPFSDHLRYYWWWLKESDERRAAMKSAILKGMVPSDEGFFSLRSAGLVTGHSREACQPRCGLYRAYFKERL